MNRRSRITFFQQCLITSLLLFLSLPALAAIIAGNPKGTITLVEFFDYQCPHCHVMANVINRLIVNNPDLRVIYRIVPVINPNSKWQAQMVLAACNQTACEPFHQALMSLPINITLNQVINMASAMGLNIKQLQEDAQSPSVMFQIKQNITAFNAMHNAGVPVLLLGRTSATRPQFHLLGEIPESVLQQDIDQLK